VVAAAAGASWPATAGPTAATATPTAHRRPADGAMAAGAWWPTDGSVEMRMPATTTGPTWSPDKVERRRVGMGNRILKYISVLVVKSLNSSTDMERICLPVHGNFFTVCLCKRY
jgi:hypothetical protein